MLDYKQNKDAYSVKLDRDESIPTQPQALFITQDRTTQGQETALQLTTAGKPILAKRISVPVTVLGV
jgi:hypothetical protein